MDLEKASVARVYDYYLGGSHNFAADRQVVVHLTKPIDLSGAGA